MTRRRKLLMRAIGRLGKPKRRMVTHIIPFPFSCAVVFGGKSLEMRPQAIYYDARGRSTSTVMPYEMTEIKMTGTISNADVDALFDMVRGLQ